MYALDLNGVLVEYVNRACGRMYRFHSDVAIHDVESIKSMGIGDTIYFIVTPTNSHLVEPSYLAQQRNVIGDIWGNNIVIAIKRKTKNEYYIVNYAKDLNHNWDAHTPHYIRESMRDFTIDEICVVEFEKL